MANHIVAGTGFRNSDGRSRAAIIRRYCGRHVEVSLRREPDNPYDANAVAVWIKFDVWIFFSAEFQIGYLKAGAAKRIAPRLDAGEVCRARVDSMWAPDDIEHPRVSLSIDFQ